MLGLTLEANQPSGRRPGSGLPGSSSLDGFKRLAQGGIQKVLCSEQTGICSIEAHSWAGRLLPWAHGSLGHSLSREYMDPGRARTGASLEPSPAVPAWLGRFLALRAQAGYLPAETPVPLCATATARRVDHKGQSTVLSKVCEGITFNLPWQRRGRGALEPEGLQSGFTAN